MSQDEGLDLEPSSSSSYFNESTVSSIDEIYIRNLTPFPRRDRVVSRPLPSYLLRNDGHGLDDIDIALTRYRVRHVSSASVTTFKSTFSDDAVADEEAAAKPNLVKRRTSMRRTSGPNTAHRRNRTTSTMGYSSIGPDSPISAQRTLEAIVSSRLFETFVTINLPLNAKSEGYDAQRHPSGSQDSPARGSYAHRNATTNKPNTPSSLQGLTKNGSPRSSFTRTSPSQSSVLFPSASKAVVQDPVYDEVPCFISSVHSSSTNPSWTSLEPEDDFSPGANLGATRFELTLWGRRNHLCSPNGTSSRAHSGSTKGKENADQITAGPRGWHPVATWRVDLQCLQPLTPDFQSMTEQLPPNSLVLRLSTTGKLYLVPLNDPSTERPPIPEHQNLSDGEIDTLRPTRANRRTPHIMKPTVVEQETKLKSLRETKMKHGAPLAAILKLIGTRRSVDMELSSLGLLVDSIDLILVEDSPLTYTRRYNELQCRIDECEGKTLLTTSEVGEVRSAIQRRHEMLNKRRMNLRVAQSILSSNQHVLAGKDLLASHQEARLSSQRASLQTRRATIIRSLERMFPIEPTSPSTDLLFTIVGVPLPIPSNPTDPAPPLHDPKHPDVNEDSTASALGYAAQVVNLLAFYLGHILPYPMTCANSRSLVKDPISSMHGPRMFPLYPKGVDTYRFEYAVFLLNKNIEKLMTEHNLQALDMRHTLPNLKNLLLTLTTEATEDDPAPPTVREPLRPQDMHVTPTTIGLTSGRVPASLSSIPDEIEPTSSETTHPSSRRSGLFRPIALPGFWQSRNARSSPALIKSSLPVTPEDPGTPGSDSATVRSLHFQKAPIDGASNHAQLPQGTSDIVDGQPPESSRMSPVDTGAGIEGATLGPRESHEQSIEPLNGSTNADIAITNPPYNGPDSVLESMKEQNGRWLATGLSSSVGGFGKHLRTGGTRGLFGGGSQVKANGRGSGKPVLTPKSGSRRSSQGNGRLKEPVRTDKSSVDMSTQSIPASH